MILANMFGFGNPVELGIIAVVALVLFGGTKIAGFGKNLGEGLKEFKKATREEPELKETTPAQLPSTTDTTKKAD